MASTFCDMKLSEGSIVQLDTHGKNPRSVISNAERARRQAEVDFARGSVRYEGGALSPEIEKLNACYIAGEIDSDEFTAALVSSSTAQRPSP
jgi:hypothetical protein